MKILIAAAEVAPFARVGGLSDVAGALSKEIAALGNEVWVFLPRYSQIDGAAYGLKAVAGAGDLSVPMGAVAERAAVWEAAMPGGPGVRALFVENERYFGRPGIYTDPATGEGCPDEPERYAFFSRATIVAARSLGLSPDVLHLNDHHTAMIAAYLRGPGMDAGPLDGAGIVFSIHNLGYQGWFAKALLPRLGFQESVCVPGSPFEFNGQVNAMKIGIEYADMVNTVSERYAVEIATTPEYGLGLEGVLAEKTRAGRLVGILNGVDYSVWDPSADALLPARFSAADLSGKAKCRVALARRTGLEALEGRPVVGIVSRLADQKGFDLIRAASGDILGLGVALVVLGTGQQEYHALFTELAARHPGRVSVNLAFDNELAHWIEAGADMFLMPSRYEPCGLNQMYSLRYGTVPVVRETGGLADTVSDYDPVRDYGTGFVFREYKADALTSALSRAVAAYREPARWAGIMQRGMALDYSWKASAGKYAKLYEDAARLRRA